MDTHEHVVLQQLERYAFLWSEVRLLVAALALLLGGVPPVYYIVQSGLLLVVVTKLLMLAWVVSGTASGYLLYRYLTRNTILFGNPGVLFTVAFWVSSISGIHLGIAGLTSYNIGLSFFSNQTLLTATAIAYVASSYVLYHEWKQRGERFFV